MQKISLIPKHKNKKDCPFYKFYFIYKIQGFISTLQMQKIKAIIKGWKLDTVPSN